ncbi:MAG: DUF4167 domain-containing protein [Phenylobacterium sp.]|uniref:DUF4167 domain-containing protein n=1 Tax=Phenylobacterium sp. TaxID=1871053 RepID=UPI002A35DA22|nr:DUF4167 domain-containing protein [Phenylobacterium sp.]MDX9996908.1 DUF4167 domain-containing protein [Phenylobacterium sp.]
MRDFKGMKRQRGRTRGGGGGKPQQSANRAFDSNGPDGVKVRGNAQHVFEKYQQLARDAGSAGDRVLAENYLQHAEHYFRLLRAMQPQRPASEILGRDQFASGFDIDFEDESGAQAAAEAEAQEAAETAEADGEGREQRPEGRRDRDDRQRDDRQRDDRQRDRFEGRRERDDRRDRFRDRDDRRDRGERGDRPERDPLPVTEPQATPLVAAEERPSPVLRDAEGGESHAPAFLQSSVAPRTETADGEEAPAKRPRRRRAPRTFEAGAEGAPPPSPESEEV